MALPRAGWRAAPWAGPTRCPRTGRWLLRRFDKPRKAQLKIHSRETKLIFYLTDDVGLQLPREDRVHDAVAIGEVDLRPVDEVPVQEVQRGDEELVRVLLLVARQVVRMRPRHVQEDVRDERGLGAGVKLLRRIMR